MRKRCRGSEGERIMNEKYPHIDAYRTGQNIKWIMRFKGFTVRDLQAYLSLSVPQTIYRWFEGRNLPSIDNLYALSGLFGVPMDALVAGDREERLRHGEWRQEAAASQEKAVNWESISGWRKRAAEYRLIAYYRRLCMPLAG